MKKNLVAVMVGMVMAMGAVQAHAEGCLKGAAVGAVAGHFVGKGHAVLGAVGGCVVGRHMAKKKHEQEAQAAADQARAGY
jgi:outer membrane lipoprotein SlyB